MLGGEMLVVVMLSVLAPRYLLRLTSDGLTCFRPFYYKNFNQSIDKYFILLAKIFALSSTLMRWSTVLSLPLQLVFSILSLTWALL
jgi:hypothetical protein